jgi:F420-dependent oxidoreductase-like protein
VELAIMIEGQDGLTWERWHRLATMAEDGGFAGLFRSDHFTNPEGPHTDALDLWASLTYLACNTSRIEFGQLVSPASVRNPVVTAWTAAAISDLSGGRLRLGLGAGWQDREHTSYGFALGDLDERFTRLQEALEVVTLLLRSNDPVSFSGRFFTLKDALLLPRPAQAGHPPVVIGGNGPKRTLPLVARYADEWNAVGATRDRVANLNTSLDALITARGRQPSDVKRSLMTRVIVGKDDAQITTKLKGRDRDELAGRGAIIVTPTAIVDQLGALESAGVSRVQAQWLDMDDIPGLELLAAEVIPQLG